MWEIDAVVSEVIQRTPDVKSFRFPVGSKQLTYQPGQFFFVTIKINDGEATHHFSFSSSPTEPGYIEFTKKITASEFSQALVVLKPGDRAHLTGPEGSFVLPRQPDKLAFLSGGIGITPLRSMLRYIVDKHLPYDLVLLYGNDKLEKIVFRAELDLMARSAGIRVEYVLSGPEFPADWHGPRGFIDRAIIEQSIPDFKHRHFYISGPPKMVLSLQAQLTALNVPPARIKRDSFTGYD